MPCDEGPGGPGGGLPGRGPGRGLPRPPSGPGTSGERRVDAAGFRGRGARLANCTAASSASNFAKAFLVWQIL